MEKNDTTLNYTFHFDKILKSAKHSWLILFLLFWGTELACYGLRESSTNLNLPLYLSGLILMLIFFYVLDIIRTLLPKPVRIVYNIILSFILSFILISSIIVYFEFGEFITSSKMQFCLNHLSYLGAFIKEFLFNWNILLFFVIWGLIYFILNTGRDISRNFKKSIFISVSLIILYLVAINQIMYHSNTARLDIITTSFLSVKKLNHKITEGLYKSERKNVANFNLSDSINVILLINESLGKKAFDINDTACPMTFLKQFALDNRKQFFIFSNSFSNSSATDVSVPSILTGVLPYEPSRKIHTMPLLWNWAKSAGMTTCLVSAQYLTWAGFDKFFHPYPDYISSAENINKNVINDGIDEMVSIKKFCSTLNFFPNKKNFLAVYNSNALHDPYQQHSIGIEKGFNYNSKYQNAAAILDRAYFELFNFLKSKGLLENTVIIITGDHADYDKLCHRISRIYSFYDEIQHIPLMMYLPERLIHRHPDYVDNLKNNENRITSNSDILPTIVDILGGKGEPENAKLFNELLGYSLVKEIPETRYTIALNTNDIRQWDKEGFGIYWKEGHFVYSDVEKGQYFDIKSDPNERINILNKLPDSKRKEIEAVINQNFHLNRIYSK